MDVLNFISWLKSKRQVTTVDASQTLIPVGLKDARRGDGYIPGTISVTDFASTLTPQWGSIQGSIYEQSDLQNQFSSKQDTLYSGSNIKTINGTSVLGSGNITVQDILVSGTNIKTINGSSILGAGNIIAGAPTWLESNATDFTLWNNGKNNLSNNTSFGENALKSITTGDNNTAYGFGSLSNTQSGQNNVAVGTQALSSNNNSNNTGIGYKALYVSQSDNNVAIGSNAAEALTTASGIGQNTAIGASSLGNSDIGFRNVSVGFMAHRDGLNPRESVAVGFEALYNFTNFYSVAVGRGALRANTTGPSNVAVGANAASNVTTGDSNTAIGAGALTGTTIGASNIAIGSGANSLNNTGNASIVIGVSAQAQNYSNSIVLGRSATATSSNQFVVGSTTYNAGTVVTAAQTQTKYWEVVINGVTQRILLA